MIERERYIDEEMEVSIIHWLNKLDCKFHVILSKDKSVIIIRV